MLGIDARAAKIAWSVALVALALYAIFVVRKTLFIFALVVFLSYMIAPLVNLLGRRLRRNTPRVLPVLIAFTLVFGVIVIALALIGPVISAQATAFMERLPQLADKLGSVERLPLPGLLEPMRARLEAFVHEIGAGITGSSVPFVQAIGKELLRLAANLPFILLIPVLSFLFLNERGKLKGDLLRWLKPVGTQAALSRLITEVDAALGRYVLALGGLSLATLIAYASFFLLTGVPFGLLLAAIAAVLEFIPVLGPLTAAVAAVVVAGAAGYDHLLWLVVFFLVYRFFQDYLLAPKLMSGGARVHPALIIFGFLAGGELAGIPGIFVSVPVMAILAIIARVSFVEKQR